MYFIQNKTFSEFRYLANGGWPGLDTGLNEGGGPGTVFLYHMVYDHRTLLIDNDGVPNPREKYVNWDDTDKDGPRAWILPTSGLHDFAGGSYLYEFEELQIYGNGHLAVLQPSLLPQTNIFNPNAGPIYATNANAGNGYNVTLFFKYMIGDRTGSVHVAAGQIMDLIRDEIDLPFNCYVYRYGFLGLANMTFVHGIEIHLSGVMANVENITLHHGGYLWLKDGGHTLGEPESSYSYEFIRIQDEAVVNATTDPVEHIGITFYTKAITVEGGGVLHGTYMTFTTENVTVDAGGLISTEGLGYMSHHSQATHGSKSVHGLVNVGTPDGTYGTGAGAGHGGSGGHGHQSNSRSGFAYGNLYEPDRIGSAGGHGPNGHLGGSGGGVIWMNVTNVIDIDGEVSARGGDADGNGGGGGSGGSVWMWCYKVKGYGKITAHGGHGSSKATSPGGGGAGGRIAMYFKVNETMSSFRYQAIGGKAGIDGQSENGGGGTAFIYHMLENHTTLILDNGGQQPKDKWNVIDDYGNLESDSCRTWILPESGRHYFAGGGYNYSFNELQVYGAAHLAILPDPVNTPVDVFFLYMIGDRSGTVHLGNNQRMDLERYEIDLPFSVRAYAGSYTGLGTFTIVHGVSIWMHGELANIENITLHHNGLLSMESGGHTKELPPDYFFFLWCRIQENSTIWAITDPVTQPGMNIKVDYSLYIEGGGTLIGTNITLEAHNITIDSGGLLTAMSLGYRPSDTITSVVNLGRGISHTSGSSGAGHGGTSGRGHGTTATGNCLKYHYCLLDTGMSQSTI